MYRMQLVLIIICIIIILEGQSLNSKNQAYWNMWHVLNEVNKMTCQLGCI